MKVYTLTENEFHYLTRWNDLGKKSKSISRILFGVTLGLIEQAFFSYPTTPIGLAFFWLGVLFSTGLGFFYHFQKDDLQDATQTVEQTIKNETVHSNI